MTTRLFIPAIPALCLLLAIVGCGDGDPASMVASGKSYLTKADPKAAIIQFKNALQKKPDNGEARFLLAKSLMETGDVPGAETEVRKAIDLNYSPDDSYPLLATTLLAQGEFRKLVTELNDRKLGTPQARADLLTSIAVAQLALADPKAARTAIESAVTEKPDFARALVVKASILAQANDFPGALKLVDAALAATPDDAEAMMLKAELQIAQGARDDAIKTLQRAIEVKPGLLNLRFALASTLILAGQVEAADRQLTVMQQLGPQDFRTLYSDALVSYAKNDMTHAREVLQKVLGARPKDVPSLYLFGLVNYQLQSFAAAEDALRQVVSRAPNDVSARRVLAAVYLRTGRAAQAMETIAPALRRAPDEPTLLRIAAEAALQTGNPAKAAEQYERANTLDKSNVASKVRLAQVRFATGDSARAMKDLETLAQTNQNENQADLALITAHLRRREFDQALASIDALEKKQPATALTQNTRGIVYMAKRDLKGARTALDKALVTDPAYFSAAYNLALIDVQEGKPEDARKRYERMLEKSPKNEQLMLALAELDTVTGATADSIKASLERTIAANPSSPRPRLALISYYARQRDLKNALTAAQNAQSIFPDDPQFLDTVGAFQLALGDGNQAVETFRRWVQLQPESPQALLRLAEASIAVKDYVAAISLERKVIALQPDMPQAWGALAKTLLVSGRPEDAIAEAKKVQKEKPTRALGYALEGEVLAAQKKWAEAAVALRNGLSRQPIPLLATATYVALQNAGKQAEASALADKWIKDHPKDVDMRALMAQQNQLKKDYKAAQTQYQAVLEIDPENVPMLNNLAWVLGEMSDPKALDYANRAYRLAPFNPAVMDTLGWTLLRGGDTAKGTPLLKMATNLAPSNNEIRMHYAKALLKTGDKALARAQLEVLTQADPSSPIRAEADKMMTEL